jgi:hypothetical protein
MPKIKKMLKLKKDKTFKNFKIHKNVKFQKNLKNKKIREDKITIRNSTPCTNECVGMAVCVQIIKGYIKICS